MDLLEDWIGSRVQRALTEALDWKSQGSPAGQHGKEFSFENDGNSIRAKSSKKEYVQITKVSTSRLIFRPSLSTGQIVGESAKGVQLWISDSRTHLEVVIATEATERFEREERYVCTVSSNNRTYLKGLCTPEVVLRLNASPREELLIPNS